MLARNVVVRFSSQVALISALMVSLLSTIACAQNDSASSKQNALRGPIVLVAGEVTKKDVVGHHDYLGGCKALEQFLRQTPGVEVRIVTDGWPEDTKIFDQASCVVFYTDGGGKQAFLNSPERIEAMDQLAKRGAGLVFIHQAVDFPAEHADRARGWLGGIYLASKSGRGHWPSTHVDFPNHPISRGVTAWKVNDGWLNKIDFVSGMQGITPLVWSGKQYAGSRSGLDADIVGWAYERPNGGRTFCFTGLDAHSAWSLVGMRQLVVNGVLWSAGQSVPESGAPCAISDKISRICRRRASPRSKCLHCDIGRLAQVQKNARFSRQSWVTILERPCPTSKE